MTLKPYDDFLAAKGINDFGNGFEVNTSDLNPILFGYQSAILKWNLHIGRSLVGANCGLGKGPILLEWSKQVYQHTDKPVILFAPPGVKIQFKYESVKFEYDVNIINEESEIINGTNITNYERLTKKEWIEDYGKELYFKQWAEYQPVEIGRKYKNKDDGEYGAPPNMVQVERFRFNPNQFGGIALDEASILKHWGSKTREWITRFGANIPFRICATATPAPNDIYELGNYAEFLGILRSRQVKAQFFIQDGNTSSKFRLMKPAIKKWWAFVAQWAIIIEKPSDIGYSDEGYELPELEKKYHILKDTNIPKGMVCAVQARTLTEQSRVKRQTVKERCEIAAKIANADNDHKLIFVRRNDEGILLQKLIPGSVELAGRHKEEIKEQVLMDFAQGKIHTLITKPEIGGFGLNFQEFCHRIISVNVNYSSEELYQYERRVWRFGQINEVQHDIIAMDTEGDIINALERKIKATEEMTREVIKNMNIHDLNDTGKTKKEISGYDEDEYSGEYWKLLLGDSCQRLKELEDHSIDTIVTSVPFPAMYAYTNLDEDIGNYETAEELCEHLKYVFIEALPKMKPGSIAHIHIAQGIAFGNRHGYMGLWDFRAEIVKMMWRAGWEHYAEVTIEKDPQTQASRNHSYQLMQQTVFTNAAALGASVSDYLIMFKVPGEKEKVNALLSDPAIQGKYKSPDGWITMDMWINWASNVWLMHRKGMKWWEGINVTQVLGALLDKKSGERNGFGIREARDEEDEKHLCELQLNLIERVIAIHTKAGDTVLDPFDGIGSVGFQSLLMGRQFVGIELKKSYWLTSIKNLEYADHKAGQIRNNMFSILETGDTTKDDNELVKRHKQWMSDRGISLHDRATKWFDWEPKQPKLIQTDMMETIGIKEKDNE